MSNDTPTESTTKRWVTESDRPTFVTFGDQFTVDFAAEEQGHSPGEERTLCFPIVADGKPVIWMDREGLGYVQYTRLVEDALKVAAKEIAALRLQLAKK